MTPLMDAAVAAGHDVLLVTGRGGGSHLARFDRGRGLADQPWNAARLAELDLAVVVHDSRDAGAALQHALHSPAHHVAAQAAARAVQNMPAADDVLIRLLEEAVEPAGGPRVKPNGA